MEVCQYVWPDNPVLTDAMPITVASKASAVMTSLNRPVQQNKWTSWANNRCHLLIRYIWIPVKGAKQDKHSLLAGLGPILDFLRYHLQQNHTVLIHDLEGKTRQLSLLFPRRTLEMSTDCTGQLLYVCYSTMPLLLRLWDSYCI